MFDMKNKEVRRQVLAVLGIVLFLSCIPAFLVVFTHASGRLITSILIGVALYFIFLRKK